MEPMIHSEGVKLADMVMCGDHPSVTKTELNVKEARPEEKARERCKEPPLMASYGRISPTSSRTDRERAISEHALRATEARRRRSLEAVAAAGFEQTAPPNRALVQAALGSFRWPPYLLVVWVLVLLATHALHCLVGLLERTLPPLRKCCQYFRAWTEESWKGEDEAHGRLSRAGLAALTGLLYTGYFGLHVVHRAALWAVEPLSAEAEDKAADDSRLADYGDVNSKSCSSVKH